jgi:hypothetical protein
VTRSVAGRPADNERAECGAGRVTLEDEEHWF